MERLLQRSEAGQASDVRKAHLNFCLRDRLRLAVRAEGAAGTPQCLATSFQAPCILTGSCCAPASAAVQAWDPCSLSCYTACATTAVARTGCQVQAILLTDQTPFSTFSTTSVTELKEAVKQEFGRAVRVRLFPYQTCEHLGLARPRLLPALPHTMNARLCTNLLASPLKVHAHHICIRARVLFAAFCTTSPSRLHVDHLSLAMAWRQRSSSSTLCARCA